MISKRQILPGDNANWSSLLVQMVDGHNRHDRHNRHKPRFLPSQASLGFQGSLGYPVCDGLLLSRVDWAGANKVPAV